MDSSILVADGHRECADGLVRLFASTGLNAVAVYDGRDVVPRARDLHLAAVVMDLELPGMSGLVVAGELRKAYGDSIHLVAYTDSVSVGHRDAASDAGFEGVVPKGADPMELLAAISPQFYQDILVSMRAAATHFRHQITLCYSFIQLGVVSRNSLALDRSHDLARRRLQYLQSSIGRIALLDRDRGELRAELEALAARLKG